MSQENVEVMRRSFDLWRSGDIEASLETIDPKHQLGHLHPPAPRCPKPRSGARCVRNGHSANLTELIDAGDDVVDVLHETATMRETGAPLDRDLVQLWTVRDGRATFLRVFQAKAEAVEAAGLQE